MARRSGMDGRAVFRATSGNPFFVTELLRGGREQPPPASVQDAVLARADRLSDAARTVLDAVSVFPGRAETVQRRYAASCFAAASGAGTTVRR